MVQIYLKFFYQHSNNSQIPCIFSLFICNLIFPYWIWIRNKYKCGSIPYPKPCFKINLLVAKYRSCPLQFILERENDNIYQVPVLYLKK